MISDSVPGAVPKGETVVCFRGASVTDRRFESMDRRFDEFQARVEAAEGALRMIHAAIAYWMPPASGIEDQDLISVITEILEEYGMPFVPDDAFKPVDRAPELPF